MISRNYECIISKILSWVEAPSGSPCNSSTKVHSPDKPQSGDRVKIYDKKLSELEKENKKLKHKISKLKKMAGSTPSPSTSLEQTPSSSNLMSPSFVEVIPPPDVPAVSPASSLRQALQKGSAASKESQSPATDSLGLDEALAASLTSQLTNENAHTTPSDVSALLETLQGGKTSDEPDDSLADLAAGIGSFSYENNGDAPNDDVSSLMQALSGGAGKDISSDKDSDLNSVKSGDGVEGEAKVELLVDDSLFRDSEAVRRDESAAIRLTKMISKAENLMVVLSMKKFPFASAPGNNLAVGSEAGNSSLSSSSGILSQKSAGSKKKRLLNKL